MKKNTFKKDDIVIYQAKNGAIELKGDVSKETIWASQAEIASIFGVDRTVITKHIRNVLKDKELDSNSVCAKFAHTGEDGKVYQVQFYNLDVILSVGYRTNSKLAIEFRKWATKTLREHIVKGYTINRKQISKNYNAFIKSVEGVRSLLPENIVFDSKAVIDLIKEFADTWVSLDAYDKDSLPTIGATKKSARLTGLELFGAIAQLREELQNKGEATELFAQEKNKGSVEGIVGNVMQSFDGKSVYNSIEEKAAHLLYFMVKNHPFTDGNKRSGAFAFIWFLRKCKLKSAKNINQGALTALTLLVAESSPQKKEQMVALITQILK